MRKPQPHSGNRRRKRIEYREPAFRRGYGHWWRVNSDAWILAHPECVDCGLIDIRSRMVVDHIKPHRGDMVFFRDMGNWATRCRTCHGRKTARGE